jgi:hypothetical protein
MAGDLYKVVEGAASHIGEGERAFLVVIRGSSEFVARFKSLAYAKDFAALMNADASRRGGIDYPGKSIGPVPSADPSGNIVDAAGVLGPSDIELLDTMFKFHPVEAGQVEKYAALRSAAKLFAVSIMVNCPASADRTTAIRKVREAVMTGCVSIALKGRV